MLRNRPFLFLWLVTMATTLALELLTVGILVTVFEQTGSTLQAAGTMVARTLVGFLLGPIAGVLVDRFPRKHVLVSMDLVRVLLVGVAVWLLQRDAQVPLAGVYLLLAGLSAAGVFHRPARMALIPSLVPHDELVRANSFILVSSQVVLAISYTIGGWLVLAIPLSQIALCVVVLFALAVLAAMLMRVPKREDAQDADQKESFAKSLVTGWRYLRRHAIARPLTIMETIEHLPHGIWTGALMLAFTEQALGGDASDWGLQTTAYFAGMIIGSMGSLAISRWLGRYPGRVIALNAFVAGALTLAFAGSQSVWMAVLLALLFGPPNAIRDVAQDSLLQGTVEGGQMGRVYATREMLLSLVFMFAGILFAWLSDLVPIRFIYVAGGVIYLLTGFYALGNRALRESSMDLHTRIDTQPPHSEERARPGL